MLSKEESSLKDESRVEKSGFIDGVFYLTNEELAKIVKGNGFRWPWEGYVNLRGGLDPTTKDFNSNVLSGNSIDKLVLGPLNPKLAAEIKHLDISFNPELKSLEPKEELEKLTNLKFLEFKYSHRKEVPTWIKHLPALEAVLMGVNQVRILPAWLTEKPGMKVVSLFMNNLEEIESYGEIEELNVASNKTLRSIPSLKPKTKLKDLEAERCDLEALPENIFTGDLVKCVINHNSSLGATPLPSAPRETNLRLFSATFCGLVEVPIGLIKPEIFIKI